MHTYTAIVNSFIVYVYIHVHYKNLFITPGALCLVFFNCLASSCQSPTTVALCTVSSWRLKEG